MPPQNIDDDQAASVSWLTGRPAEEGSAPPLPRAPARNILEDLLDIGPAGVGTLSSTALHRVVAEVGLQDAHELLELAHAEQVREIVDLEVWTGDRVDLDTLLDWTQALASLNEQASARHLRGLDVELLGFLLRTQTRIYLAQHDDVPEEPEGVFYSTPDGWFVIDLLCDDELRADQVTALIEALYRDDPPRARALLQNVMWELPSELEEAALRWRNGRLLDLGFEDPLEALRVYAYLDPTTVNAGEATADRPLRADPEPVGDPDRSALAPVLQAGFFAEALAYLEPAEGERVTRALAILANRVLSADRVSPADVEHARHSLSMLRGRLSLGLEHLCDGSPERGPHVLSRVALARIARLGYSLILDARRSALSAARRGLWGRRPRALDLLPPLLARRIGLLLASRPLLALSEPPRPFERRHDLHVAKAWIDEALVAAALVPAPARPATIPDGRTLADLFRTSAVNRALGRPDTPLDQDALQRLRTHHLESGPNPAFSSTVVKAARELMQERLSGQDIDLLSASRLIQQLFTELAQSLHLLSAPEADLRFVDGLVFVADEKEK